MKLTSQAMKSTGSPMSANLKRARVDAFVQHHARVGAQFPIELAGADIDGVNARGAGLQQGVGEAAGGGADIEADLAGDVDGEVAQRAGQFEAAAADVRRAREHLEAASSGDGLAGLGGFLAVDAAPRRP